MAPLVLNGDTLGEKHHHFNKLVTAHSEAPKLPIEKINDEEADIDNLLRIDIASKIRDVQFILDVLACDDMLYVCRAVNKSTWLITDPQYAHIINPQHLYEKLFPKITTKAKTKLLKEIRLKLKTEPRVDQFFNYYYKDDFKLALKWLPNCSTAFIENIVKNNADNIDTSDIVRLCEKSFQVLKIYCNSNKSFYYRTTHLLQKTMFLLNTHTTEFLDIMDSLEHYKPTLGKKATQKVMAVCPERIIGNFEKYCKNIDISTFASVLQKEDIPHFLLKQKQNSAMKNWFEYENIKHFVKHLPVQNRFQFVKSLMIDKKMDADSEEQCENDCLPYAAKSLAFSSQVLCCQRSAEPSSNNAHIYRWYEMFAPFNTAFTDLKKLIVVESSPSERNTILTVLLKCAGSNQEHIRTVLEFYRGKHINETFKYKVQFVNSLISLTSTHKFDEKSWSILNDIFSSLEVYVESDNNVTFCIHAIIIRKLLHNEPIPDIISKKFTFSTFKVYRKKLNNEKDNEILFSYLYNYLTEQLNNPISSEAEIATALDWVQKMLDLIYDWHRNVTDYPFIISKIKEMIKLKTEKSWTIDLSSLYTVRKVLRKHLFEESLILNPCVLTYINALKHNPNLLKQYKKEVETLFTDDSIPLHQVLRKIRIYWHHTISRQWSQVYLERIHETKGQRAVLKGICNLLPRHEILPIIKQNVPTDTKISWTDGNESTIQLRKNIAKHMHLVRPSINVDIVLLYAKQDYLFFALPSLNAILYNLSPARTSECIMKLLDAPVSLRKHGIRLAFKKLNIHEMKDVIYNIWKDTKNSTIKTVLFKETFKLLCKEKNDAKIRNIWELIEMYIDTLTSEENRIIYNTLRRADIVPKIVKALFYKKSYLYLKSLPAKANCNSIIKELDFQAIAIMGDLEPSFVEDVLLESVEEKLVTKNFDSELNSSFPLISSYLLSTKEEHTQTTRYEKLLLPILEKSFASWHLYHKDKYYIKKCIGMLLNQLLTDLNIITLHRNYVVPVKLFKEIQSKLSKALSIPENYDLIMTWNTTVLLTEHINGYLILKANSLEEETNKMDKMCSAIASSFGETYSSFLKQEALLSQYSSLYTFAADVLTNVLSSANFSTKNKCIFLKSLLSNETVPVVFCIAIQILRNDIYSFRDEEVKIMKKEIDQMLRSNVSTEVIIHWSQYNSLNQ